MVSLLVLFAILESYRGYGISYKYVNKAGWYNRYNGNFEILYDGEKTSFESNGWATVFSVNNKPNVFILGSNLGVALSENVLISTRLSRPFGFNSDWLHIEFVAKNLGIDPCNVSIAAYCDIQIFSNDKAWVYPFAGTRGITVEDNKKTNGEATKFTLIVRDGYGVENVDTFWYGRWEYITAYHFWDNLSTPYPEYKNGIDTTFSLGWKNRLLQPLEEKSFGILFGGGDLLNTPPIISFTNEFKKDYKPGESIELEVKINDFDFTNMIVLYYNFSNGAEDITYEEVGDFYPSESQTSKTMNFTIKIGNKVGSYNLSVFAIEYITTGPFFYNNNNTIQSNVLQKKFKVNQAPILKMVKSINQKYFINGAIEIYGTLWDDTFSYITYRIDDSFDVIISTPVYCNYSEKGFRRSIGLRENYLTIGKHKITIWATDQFAVASNKYQYEFVFERLYAPTVQVLTVANESGYRTNDEIIINGTITDDNFNDYNNNIVSLYVKLPSDDIVGPLRPSISILNERSFNWSYSYVVEYGLPPGNYSLIFQAINNYGAISKDAVFNFCIYEEIIRHVVIPIAPRNTEDNNTFSFVNKDPPKKLDKKFIIIIAGIAAVILAGIIGALLVLCEAKKPAMEFEVEDVHKVDVTMGIGCEMNNPLYDTANPTSQPIDPFKDDFTDDNTVTSFFKINK